MTYRLLPMNRGVLSGIFTESQAKSHLDLIKQHLLAPDGARLMDKPPAYCGGKEINFQRAESAACFGREIGLQYVHAHLRYAEALALSQRPDEFLHALLQVNPVAIRSSVPNAQARQANAYFSSSDADFLNRYDADENYDAIKRGDCEAKGGWRIYSSGPGIYLRLVVEKLLGLSRRFGDVCINPALPASLDGLAVEMTLLGRPVRITYQHVAADAAGVWINDTQVQAPAAERGGWVIEQGLFHELPADRVSEIQIRIPGAV